MNVVHSQETAHRGSSAGTLRNSVLTCQLHTRHLSLSSRQRPFNPMGLSQRVSTLEQPCILGGHNAGIPGNDVSYWTADPVEVVEIPNDHPAPLDLLEHSLSKYRLTGTTKTLIRPLFCCGWIGYFSYDLGAAIEPMPVTTKDDLKMPLVRLGFYDRCIAWDHKDDSIWLMTLALPHDSVTPEQKLESLETLLNNSDTVSPVPTTPATVDSFNFADAQTNMTKEQYLHAVQNIRGYLLDGETYQINFSHRFSLPFSSLPIDLFHWQSSYNPNPYCAFLDGPDFQIVSASPEMFLTWRTAGFALNLSRAHVPNVWIFPPMTWNLPNGRPWIYVIRPTFKIYGTAKRKKPS